MINITSIEKSDVEEICFVQNECQLAVWKTDDYLAEINRQNSVVLVAKCQGKVVGFVIGRLSICAIADNESHNDSVTELEAEILNFGVLNEFQRKGIGGKLFNELLKKVQERKARAIWLDVRASNFTAIKFYKNRGFCEIQKRKYFYTSPSEDAIVMKLNLM